MNHPSNKISLDVLDEVFTYHNDTRRHPHYDAIRKAGKDLAAAILENTPSCADQSAALRKVREVVMTANAAIALAPNYPWEG